MKEQGCLVDCVYCKYIKPELQGLDICPKCHGQTPFFQPAQMMDQDSSSSQIFNDLLSFKPDSNNDSLFNFWYNILKRVDMYNFDFKHALVRYLQEEVGYNEKKE